MKDFEKLLNGIDIKIEEKCKKILFVFIFILNAAFAGFPSPVKSANIRVVYIVDTFDDDVIDTEVSRSVLDSIFQDVNSVYFAPFGACDCDCAGGDIFFYPSNKENIRALFKTNFIARLCSSISDSLDLVLRLKDNRKVKALGENLLKQNKNRPKKKNGRRR